MNDKEKLLELLKSKEIIIMKVSPLLLQDLREIENNLIRDNITVIDAINAYTSLSLRVMQRKG